MNKRMIGAQKEKQVCAYLLSKGIRDIETNFRCRQGEIDIVGWDGEYLVFFEVKYRSGDNAGNAAEAVTVRKQRTICKVARYYCCKNRVFEDTPIRFDVIAIDAGELNWIKNAFSYIV